MATVNVDMQKLFEAGAHFGHKTSRWHPKMAPYIHSKRSGSHIINLEHTVAQLSDALNIVQSTVSGGKQVLIVGTKRQAKTIVEKIAASTGMPYVSNRWLGGMLTNQQTISARVKYLKDLEARMESGQLASKYNKLELQRFQEEIDAMNSLYGGIKHMAAKPSLVFIFDPLHDDNAVREARKLRIPIIALTDTNADPSDVDYPIACNDDAIKALELVGEYLEQAIQSGIAKQKQTASGAEEKGDK